MEKPLKGNSVGIQNYIGYDIMFLCATFTVTLLMKYNGTSRKLLLLMDGSINASAFAFSSLYKKRKNASKFHKIHLEID